MSKKTLKRLDRYKKLHKMTDVALSQKLSSSEGIKVYSIYLYRWRKAGKIKGAYEKIVGDFLKKEEANGQL